MNAICVDGREKQKTDYLHGMSSVSARVALPEPRESPVLPQPSPASLVLATPPRTYKHASHPILSFALTSIKENIKRTGCLQFFPRLDIDINHPNAHLSIPSYRHSPGGPLSTTTNDIQQHTTS